MATVGITQELLDRVKSVISGMRQAEINSDVPEHSKEYTADATFLFHRGCWGAEHVHLIDKIPKDWLAPVSAASITIKGIYDGQELKTSVMFRDLKGAYSRPKESYWNKSDCELSLYDIESLPGDTIGRSQCLQRWVDSCCVFEISKRWDKVSGDVVGFLKKCKTLNEAVKLYPGVKMYLSPDDIARLERKVERLSQRKKIVEDLATDELTAAAMAAKLVGAA